MRGRSPTTRSSPPTHRPAVLDEQLTARLLAVLTSLWEHGWQPTDLLHVARRIDAASADLRGARSSPRPAGCRWSAHQCSGGPSGRPPRPPPRRRAARIPPTDFSIVHVQLRLLPRRSTRGLAVLRFATEFERCHRCRHRRPSVDVDADRRSARPQPAHGDRDKVIAKISALLAKAEGNRIRRRGRGPDGQGPRPDDQPRDRRSAAGRRRRATVDVVSSACTSRPRTPPRR